MVDMFRCPSYYDDDGVLRDCQCGKCEPSATLRQVGTMFGVPILMDLTNTVPEDRIMIIDQSQMVLQKTFNDRVKHGKAQS